MDPTWKDQNSKTPGFDAGTSLNGGHSAAGGFDPMIDRGAAYAHTAIDKAANVIKLKDARDCIKEHPFKSIGVAAAIGLLVGKLLV